MATINIKGIDKAALLAALYNSARVQGMGVLLAQREDMTVERAREELASNDKMYFDYLHGRVMKVALLGDALKTGAYDRDNGPGAAERAIAHLLAEQS